MTKVIIYPISQEIEPIEFVTSENLRYWKEPTGVNIKSQVTTQFIPWTSVFRMVEIELDGKEQG